MTDRRLLDVPARILLGGADELDRCGLCRFSSNDPHGLICAAEAIYRAGRAVNASLGYDGDVTAAFVRLRQYLYVDSIPDWSDHSKDEAEVTAALRAAAITRPA